MLFMINFRWGKAFNNLRLNIDLLRKTFFTSSVYLSVRSLISTSFDILILDIILYEVITSVMKINNTIIIIIVKTIGGIFFIILRKNGFKMYTKITPRAPKPNEVVRLTLPFI